MHRCVTLSLLFLTLLLPACTPSDSDVGALRDAAAALDEHGRALVEGRARIRDLVHAYNQTVVPAQRIAVHFDRCMLVVADRTAIERRIDTEADASCRVMLENILDLDDVLHETCAQIDEVTASLPPAVRVREGDNHYALCRRWLVREKGMSRARADSILASSKLTPHLIAGNDVWMAWDGTAFVSVVGQGAARLAPGEAVEAARLLATEEAAARARERSEACAIVLDSVKRTGMLVGSVQTAVVP